MQAQGNPLLPPSLLSLATGLVQQISALYQRRDPRIALEKNQESFFETIRAFTPGKGDNPFSRTTFTFTGEGPFEDDEIILDLGTTPGEDWMARRALFSFVYSIGGVSKYSNMNERLASSLGTVLYLKNQALMTLMQELQVKLTTKAGRLSAEEQVATGSAPSSTAATFPIETFRDAYWGLVQKLSGKVGVFAGPELNRQDVGELSELLGINEELSPEEGGDIGGEELETGMTGDLMDLIFQLQTVLRFEEHSFEVRSATMGSVDLEDLELRLLKASLETAFDENMDAHYFKPDVIRRKNNQMLFTFYTIFWRGYLANLLPIILMSFFNFTHSDSLLDYLQRGPFLNTLLNAGQDEGLDLGGDTVGFNLKWFGDQYSTEQEENAESALEGGARRVSLGEVFENYSPHFNTEIGEGLRLAQGVIAGYSADTGNRHTALFASFRNHLRKEVLLQEEIFARGNEPEEMTQRLVDMITHRVGRTYSVHRSHVENYLLQGASLTKSYVYQDMGINLDKVPWSFLVILHLLVKWVPYNGLPSTRYFIFNTWLKPFRPLSEPLGTDEEMGEGGEEPQEGGGPGPMQDEEFMPDVDEIYPEDILQTPAYAWNREEDNVQNLTYDDPGEVDAPEDAFYPNLNQLVTFEVERTGTPNFLKGVLLRGKGQ